MTVTYVYVAMRAPHLSEEAFHDYWLNVHGPLVKGMADAFGARRYVQCHTISSPVTDGLWQSRGMLPPADGIAEMSWESVEAMREAFATPEGAEASRIAGADEANFLDERRSHGFMTLENVVYDDTDARPLGPDPIRVMYVLHRRQGMSRAACQETWLKDHGPLVNGFAPVTGMRRYIQRHTVEAEAENGLTTGRDLAPDPDGLTTAWLDSFDDLTRPAIPELVHATETMIADERRFVDLARSRCFATRDVVIFDR
jgi:uncharacterized protein (TIGR02118 family)